MRAPADVDPGLAVPLAALSPLVVGGFLVGVRGEVHPEVVALVLALVVALAGRVAGRAGGVVAALVATATFDFFHTEPYQSLKIARSDDLWGVLVLLALGIVVGDLSGRVAAERRRLRGRSVGTAPLGRVLEVAATGGAGEVLRSVQAEVASVLSLRTCWFTEGPVRLPVMGADGEVDVAVKYLRPGGFDLPPGGVALPVAWRGRTLGYLAGEPEPMVGVSVERRRVAVAMAEVLALALVAEPAAG